MQGKSRGGGGVGGREGGGKGCFLKTYLENVKILFSDYLCVFNKADGNTKTPIKSHEIQ